MLCSEVLKEEAYNYWNDEINNNFPNFKWWASPYGFYLDYDYKLIYYKDLKPNISDSLNFSECDDPEEIFSKIYQVVNNDYLFDTIYTALADEYDSNKRYDFVIHASRVCYYNNNVTLCGDIEDATNKFLELFSYYDGIKADKVSDLRSLENLIKSSIEAA